MGKIFSRFDEKSSIHRRVFGKIDLKWSGSQNAMSEYYQAVNDKRLKERERKKLENENSKLRFKSIYSDSYISAAQYITEFICYRKAQSENRDLSIKFWESDYWAKYFKNQIPTANKLLKKYDAEAIIKALKHWKAKNIYSLRAPHLIPLIEAEQKIIDSKPPVVESALDVVEGNIPIQRVKENKALNKLKDLDG
jgi:hypothetical protein